MRVWRVIALLDLLFRHALWRASWDSKGKKDTIWLSSATP
jgi:hypothetical protein